MLDDEHEFARPITRGDLDERPRKIRLEATAAERKSLARRLQLDAVGRLEAVIVARRNLVGECVVDGQLNASVVQTCVVTLDPVRSDIAEAVNARFVPPAQFTAVDAQSLAGDEAIEPLSGPTIDLGELVVQHLALAINPFPRAANAELPRNFEADADAAGHGGPFAALAGIPRRRAAGS